MKKSMISMAIMAAMVGGCAYMYNKMHPIKAKMAMSDIKNAMKDLK